MNPEQTISLLNRLTVAFASGDNETFFSLCTDDVRWTFVGDQTLDGLQAVRDFMAPMAGQGPELTLDGTIIGDQSATAYGKMVMPNAQGVLSHYAYCDVYRFEGDKIAEMTSYIVELNKSEVIA